MLFQFLLRGFPLPRPVSRNAVVYSQVSEECSDRSGPAVAM